MQVLRRSSCEKSPRGIPLESWLHFPDVPREVKRIALPEIVYSFHKNTIFRIQIRDIPIERE